jgi:capsular polysaccharide biosynthesis protein
MTAAADSDLESRDAAPGRTNKHGIESSGFGRSGAMVATLFAGILGIIIGTGLTYAIHKPVYTAEARLVVGDQTLGAFAVPGYTVATQDLAASYARLVDSDAVASQVSKVRAGSSNTVTVSASPIPESPVVRVEAQSASRTLAVDAANAAGQALISSVATLGNTDSTLSVLQRDYNQADSALSSAKAAVAAAEANPDLKSTVPALQQRAAEALNRAELAQDSQNIMVSAYANAIQNRITTLAASSSALAWTRHAGIVSDNQHSAYEIGGLLGFLMGAGLAATFRPLRTTRNARRNT